MFTLDRSQFNQVLRDILGSEHVYFQPPSNIEMQYPAIVYERSQADTQFAGNLPYKVTKRYTVTLISKKPETDLWDQIAALPSCTHSAFFVADNLNHDVFDIFI